MTVRDQKRGGEGGIQGAGRAKCRLRNRQIKGNGHCVPWREGGGGSSSHRSAYLKKINSKFVVKGRNVRQKILQFGKVISGCVVMVISLGCCHGAGLGPVRWWRRTGKALEPWPQSDAAFGCVSGFPAEGCGDGPPPN